MFGGVGLTLGLGWWVQGLGWMGLCVLAWLRVPKYLVQPLGMYSIYVSSSRVGLSDMCHALTHSNYSVPQLRAIFTDSRETWMVYTYFDVSESIYPVADQNKPTSAWQLLS